MNDNLNQNNQVDNNQENINPVVDDNQNNTIEGAQKGFQTSLAQASNKS